LEPDDDTPLTVGLLRELLSEARVFGVLAGPERKPDRPRSSWGDPKPDRKSLRLAAGLQFTRLQTSLDPNWTQNRDPPTDHH
jgi:hypothetical protein